MKTKLILLFLALSTLLNSQTPFKPKCNLPFDNIKVSHPLDKTCPVAGVPTAKNTKANATQNKAKNNFCATGDPTSVTVDELIKKHKDVIAAGVRFGSSASVPEDRAQLQTLGEGSVVSFIGYINKVNYSNVSKGETVNCKKTGAANNDIHMELTETKTEEDMCRRISAEVSPHFRPKYWEVETLKDVKESNIKIKVTGQLFFDGSHTSCADHGKGTRASSWEIHPVYRLQIFVNKEWVDLNDIEWTEEE